jgi:hypothetical protein
MSSGRKRKKAKPKKGTSDNDRKGIERDLEEGLEGTFPASDPVAVTEPVVDIVKGDL